MFIYEPDVVNAIMSNVQRHDDRKESSKLIGAVHPTDNNPPSIITTATVLTNKHTLKVSEVEETGKPLAKQSGLMQVASYR